MSIEVNINKDNILSYCRTKDSEKDKNFIQCMLGLYDMEDKMNGITPYTLRNIEPLKNSSRIDNNIKLPSIYIMEKCWDDMSMTEFYKQYNELVSTQRSSFFFQSNLINMARTFLCYHRHCLDKYYSEGKRAIFSKNKRTNSVKSDVHRGFEESKDALVSVLCKAYDTFNYKDVLTVYRSYIEFYGKHISPHISASLMGAEYPNLVDTRTNSVYKQKSHLQSIRDLFDYFETTTGIYLYLSFNTAADWKYARFLGTKIIVSDLTYKCTHGMFCNVLETILHDFNGHRVGERMIQIDNIYFRNLIERIQRIFSPEDYHFYLHMLHHAGHEESKITFGKEDIQKYCENNISIHNDNIKSDKEELENYLKEKDIQMMTSAQKRRKERLEKDIEDSEKEINLYETFLTFLDTNQNSVSTGGSRRKKQIKRRKYRTYKKYRASYL